MNKLIVVVGLLTGLVSACSGNAGGGDGEQDAVVGPLDAKSFYQKLLLVERRAACETAFNDCPNQARYLSDALGTASVEECIDVVREHIEELDPGPLPFECGRLGFDEQAARECLENVIRQQRADVCYNPSIAEKAACDAAFTPAVELGDPCMQSSECKSGHCGFGYDSFGRCEEPLPALALGEPCGTDHGICVSPLRCEVAPDGEASRICTAQGTRQAGENCIYDDSCAHGLICTDGVCISREPAELGETCVQYPANQADLSYRCAPGLVCTNIDPEYNGTCARLGEEGDPCAAVNECRIGLHCDLDSGSCKRDVAPGEACERHRACPSTYACLPDESGGTTCQQRSYGSARCQPPQD